MLHTTTVSQYNQPIVLKITHLYNNYTTFNVNLLFIYTVFKISIFMTKFLCAYRHIRLLWERNFKWDISISEV